MRGDDVVIELLNELLTMELTAINQHFLHSKMLDNWGYDELAERFRSMSMSEMKDSEQVIDRILFLEGHPNLQRLGAVLVGETAFEQLRLGLDTEQGAVTLLTRGIELSGERHDHGTRDLLEHLLVDEEGDLHWFETQLGLVEALGEQLYLSRQIDPE
jgi:bacterioferritin